MTGVVRPIAAGWVVTGAVPGPDVDEFAEADQVVAALAGPGAAGDSLLAVQHPHRTPAALAGRLSVADALPAARGMLDRLVASAYRQVDGVVAPYRVSGPDGTAVGVLCLADPAAVDAAGQARVRHSEQVYPRVAAERAAVLSGLGLATSAAMLVPVSRDDDLTPATERAIGALGEPSVRTTDSGGRVHELWLLGPGPDQDALLTVAGRHPLLVADGNHRVAAAAASDPSGLLALVTGGPDLRIGAIHRVLVGTGLTADALVAAWRSVGLDVTETTVEPPSTPGTVVALAGDRALRVTLPPADGPLPGIDHAVVEHLLLQQALGVDPAGPLVRALPANRPLPADADAVLLLAPVPFPDVLAVHDQGRRMPRKSTYFTPKPRSGLLLAGLR
ncbi:MAG TPA: DUF1015 family protein [Pseudonocardiaceae bacterium]|nr:DUF1015 family protein [Pseudonocardiaceae bacterium]